MENTLFIDAHAHLFEEKINKNLIDLSGVVGVIVSAYKRDNLRTVLDFCATNSKYFCTLGIHPEFANEYDLSVQNMIELEAKNIVAIGEIGLDITYSMPYATQISVLLAQLDLAERLDLPIVVHLRKKQDFVTFFDYLKGRKLRGMLHCFNGDNEDLARALDLGLYISFAGNITYKGNENLRKIAKNVPFSRLLIETDCPSMLPAQFRRQGVNLPQNVQFVAERLADIFGVDILQIANVTKENAKNLFNLQMEQK